MDVLFSVCIVRHVELWVLVYSDSMSVSSCRCCMFVYILCTVLNDGFCMTCSLLMLVEDARGDDMEEAYSSAGLMTALVSHECLLLLPHPVAVSAFIICRGFCACAEML